MQRSLRVIVAIVMLLLIAAPALAPLQAQAATWPVEKLGSTGPNVVALQYLLDAHGYHVSVDGIFGPQTQQAVESFQKAQGTTSNGVVGAVTWPRVVIEVQRGVTSLAVRALQYQLIHKYGYHLTVNGTFGSATYGAVTDFQRKHGLAVDGIVGSLTWNSIIALTGPAVPVPAPTATSVKPTSTPAPVAALIAVPATVNRGGVLTVSGAGFAPNEVVFIYFNALPKTVTTARATAAGLLPATGVTAPYSLAPGPHVLMALGTASRRTAPATVVVQALVPVISLSLTTVNPGGAVVVTGRGFGAHEKVTLALNSAALTTVPAVITTVDGAFSASFTVPSRLLAGPNTVSAIGNISRVTAITTLTGVLPVASRFYFAGATNTATEHSFVHVLNPNVVGASVRLTFFFGSGATDTKLVDVAAHAEKVVSVAALEAFTGPFGLYIEANRQVSAQIALTRDGKDGDTLLGNTGLGKTWYMAEGYTGLTFSESVSILNADFNVPAHVQLQLLPFGGRLGKTVVVTVPPHADYVADINSQLPHQSLSIIATSDIPISVERTLTFSNDGFGMTTRAGTNTPATSWIFAEGTTTTRFQTFLTVLNPNTTPALVTASFFGATGGSLGSKTIAVNGLSRANIKLNDVVQASGIATVVTSNLPVVVERPEYFGSPNSAYVAGSDVFGRNGAGPSWTFSGGDTGGRSEFLLVYNPSPSTVTIAATFYGSDGKTLTKDFTVAPTARETLNVNVFFAGLAPDHGIRLRATNGLGFVAEQTIFAPDYSTLESTEGSSA